MRYSQVRHTSNANEDFVRYSVLSHKHWEISKVMSHKNIIFQVKNSVFSKCGVMENFDNHFHRYARKCENNHSPFENSTIRYIEVLHLRVVSWLQDGRILTLRVDCATSKFCFLTGICSAVLVNIGKYNVDNALNWSSAIILIFFFDFRHSNSNWCQDV